MKKVLKVAVLLQYPYILQEMVNVGSEGKGLARLTREKCDLVVSIPISASTESLNASVATSIALYAVDEARRRG